MAIPDYERLAYFDRFAPQQLRNPLQSLPDHFVLVIGGCEGRGCRVPSSVSVSLPRNLFRDLRAKMEFGLIVESLIRSQAHARLSIRFTGHYADVST